MCGVTPATVGRWLDEGKLPYFSTGGGHRRVLAEDLRGFLVNHNIPLPHGLRSRPVILLVEDEPNTRAMLRLLLNRRLPDATLVEAADGFEAGRELALQAPHLVVLDLHLPGLNGIAVLRRIRTDDRLPRAAVLAISGQDPESARQRFMEAGADAFMAKPLDLDRFAREADRLVHATLLCR